MINFKYFSIIIIIIIILIIISKIESSINEKKKQKFKCPLNFVIEKLKSGDEILIYNDSNFNINSNQSYKELKDKFKYSYNPKVLLSTRLNKPFKESLESLKSIEKETFITDTVSSLIPFITYTNTLFDTKSKYTVLSNKPDLNIVSDENYIYVK